jgi:TPR repeat protein
VSNPELLARGDALFGLGDLVSARLFYERAAYGGDPKAAVQLGETYDPSFLARARLSGVSGDALLAVYWYQRARELGAPEAEILLRAIAPEKERSVP